MGNLLAFFAGAAKQGTADIAANDKYNKELQMKLYEKSLTAWDERKKEYAAAQTKSDEEILYSLAKASGLEKNWQEDAKYRVQLKNWMNEGDNRQKVIKSFDPGDEPTLDNYREPLGPHPFVGWLREATGVDYNPPGFSAAINKQITKRPAMPLPEQREKDIELKDLPDKVRTRTLAFIGEYVAREGKQPSEQMKWAMISQASQEVAVAENQALQDTHESSVVNRQVANQNLFKAVTENKNLPDRLQNQDREAAAKADQAEQNVRKTATEITGQELNNQLTKLNISIRDIENRTGLINFENAQEMAALNLAVARWNNATAPLDYNARVLEYNKLTWQFSKDRTMSPIEHAQAIANLNNARINMHVQRQSIALGNEKIAAERLSNEIKRGQIRLLPLEYHMKVLDSIIKDFEIDGQGLERAIKEGTLWNQYLEGFNLFTQGKRGELALTKEQREEAEAVASAFTRQLSQDAKTSKNVFDALIAGYQAQEASMGIPNGLLSGYVKNRLAVEMAAAAERGETLTPMDKFKIIRLAGEEFTTLETVRTATLGNSSGEESVFGYDMRALGSQVLAAGQPVAGPTGSPGRPDEQTAAEGYGYVSSLVDSNDPSYDLMRKFWAQNDSDSTARATYSIDFKNTYNEYRNTNRNVTHAEALAATANIMQGKLSKQKNGNVTFTPSKAASKDSGIPLRDMDLSPSMIGNISSLLQDILYVEDGMDIHTIVVTDPNGKTTNFNPAQFYNRVNIIRSQFGERGVQQYRETFKFNAKKVGISNE